MILNKWNYKTHKYDKYEVPNDWKCTTYCDDMDEIVNCTQCGKKIKFGGSYTSLEIHTNVGFGYAVCPACYEKRNGKKAKMEKVKIEYTKQGYSYVKCTRQDCFNWGGMAVCDQCETDIKDEVYLVFVLGAAMCKNCFEKWCNRAKRYPEDLMLQNQNHIAYYKAHGFEIEDMIRENKKHIPRID